MKNSSRKSSPTPRKYNIVTRPVLEELRILVEAPRRKGGENG